MTLSVYLPVLAQTSDSTIGCVQATFTKTLQKIQTGDSQIRKLQEFLKQFPDIYPEGQVTGSFGPLTESAVKRFQKNNNLTPDGVVGPKTRTKLNELMASNSNTPLCTINKTLPLTSTIKKSTVTGTTGATGPAGMSIGGRTGKTGAIGAIGLTGLTGATGNTGAIGSVGATGLTGGTGATGSTGSTGAIGQTGVAGTAGATGSTGNVGATGNVGLTGPAGAIGPIGLTGLPGIISSAQYVQLGAQPAPIAAGEAFTYTDAILETPSIIATTTAAPGGTIFTLQNVGRYEITYQMVYPTDGGVVLYLGTTTSNMLPLPYTMIGKTAAGTMSVSGNIIIETNTPNSVLSLNAAAGNSVAIEIPPNSSTTNQSATTISIKQISS
jgi:peptidoglycan hydrolase-like protein with peptidoglycan-binding domain